MNTRLETLFTPADFGTLRQRDLGASVCVVFDILRATTSMMTALQHGATAILPVAQIAEAVAIHQRRPEVLLAGEREGVRIRAAQTGSMDFDLGNSPREFTAAAVSGRTIAMTTTNGTRALQACVGAKRIFIGSFPGLKILAEWIRREQPAHLLLVCAGTFEEAAYEDTLAAGALADAIWPVYAEGEIPDATQIARQTYQRTNGDLLAAMAFSRNGRRLLANPELCADVPVCLQRDTISFTAEMTDGVVTKSR